MAYSNSNNTDGFIYIKRNESENTKAPYFRGFIKLTPEMIKYIESAETDIDGNIMLDVSLWKKEGSASGTVAKPYKKQAAQSKRSSSDDDGTEF